jgi:hypothetical protein
MPTSRSSPELVKTLQICLRYGTQSAAQIAHEKEARDSRYCETHQRPRLSQRGACTMTGSLTEAAPRKQSWWPRFGHFGQSPQGRPGTAIGRVESGQGADPKLARCPPGRGRRTWSRQPGRFASTLKMLRRRRASRARATSGTSSQRSGRAICQPKFYLPPTKEANRPSKRPSPDGRGTTCKNRPSTTLKVRTVYFASLSLFHAGWDVWTVY